MKNYNKNFIDLFIDCFRKFKIFKLLISIYDKYKEAILYLFFGGLTTLTNILSYTLLAMAFKVEYMVSNVIAWLVSVIFAYITNKMYVFESNTSTKKALYKEISSFFLARVFSLLLDVVIMFVGISVLYINDIIIKILSNIFVIISNYFISKFFVFKRSGKNEKDYGKVEFS